MGASIWQIRAFKRAEDRPTPRAVYNFRVYYSSMIIAIAGAMIGYDNGFVGGTLALDSFKAEFGLDKMTASHANFISANIASTFQAGCFWGALFVYPLGHYYGRKIGLTVSTAVFLVGAVLNCVASKSTGLGIMYAGRILVGLGVGATSNLGPIYISEIAPPAIRGQLLAMYDIVWQIGGLVGFWINYAVSETMPVSRKQFLIPFSVQLIPGGLLFIFVWFLRESPRWLMAEKNSPRGLENLRWFRKLDESDEYFRFEVSQIEESVESRASAIGLGFMAPIKAVFTSKKTLLRLGLTTTLFIWQNASGINAINYYSPTIFKSIGIGGTDAKLLSTGLFGVIKTVSVFLWMIFLVESWGRRLTLLVGSAGVSFCMYFLGAYVKIAHPSTNAASANAGVGNLSPGGRAAMAFFYIWTMFYSASWNWTPWIINAEIFDNNIRTFVQAINAAANWFWSFIMARFTPQMFASMGTDGYGVYFLFASLSTVGFFYVFLLIPETKGIPLEMVDGLFTKGVPAWHAHSHVLSHLAEVRDEFHSYPDDKKDVEHFDAAPAVSGEGIAKTEQA